MTWEKVKLGDCCESITDGDHQTLPLSDNGIPFIIISDINQTNNRIDFKNARYVPKKYYEALDIKRKAQKGDVLYTVKGSFGIPIYVHEETPFVFQRDIAILKCNKLMNSHFLFYVMKSKQFYQIADALAIGSAQRAITLNTLRNMQVPLPTLNEQEHIVQILSAYDDLIENNQKQIKLLEEAAQRLYKEWFVDFCFPEHETTPIINGLPEGWVMGMLGQLVEFKRGQMITKDLVQHGTVPVVAGGLEPAYYHNIANTKAPVITVSGSGANAGYTRMYHVDVFASDCSFADSNSTSFLAYAYCFLIEKKNDLKHMQKGSAQPHVYAKDINALPILIPGVHVLKKFCDIVTKMQNEIGFLEKQNTFLMQARDCLLPKLMNEEI